MTWDPCHINIGLDFEAGYAVEQPAPEEPAEAFQSQADVVEASVLRYLRGYRRGKTGASDDYVTTARGCGRLRTCAAGHEEWLWVGRNKELLTDEDLDLLEGERHGCRSCEENEDTGVDDH